MDGVMNVLSHDSPRRVRVSTELADLARRLHNFGYGGAQRGYGEGHRTWRSL